MLSEHDKQRIYEEEAYRKQAQSQLAKDTPAKSPIVNCGCPFIVVFIIIAYILGSQPEKPIPGGEYLQPNNNTSPKLPNSNSVTETNPKTLELVKSSVQGYLHDYGGEITGKVKNISGRRLDYAEIDFFVYDKKGNQLETAMTNITPLEKGATWVFKAYISSQKFSTFDLAKLEGH